jgi:hypothetical protein
MSSRWLPMSTGGWKEIAPTTGIRAIAERQRVAVARPARLTVPVCWAWARRGHNLGTVSVISRDHSDVFSQLRGVSPT